MDDRRFDDLTRDLAATWAKRRGLARLAAGGLLALLLGDGAGKTAARKKRKKKRKKKSSAPVPASPPNASSPSGCPGGQKPCNGSCIPISQCCNNADCPVSGQLCDQTIRQCACPAALPEICGGACLSPCAEGSVRTPECTCCVRYFNPSGGDLRNCCSKRVIAALPNFCDGFRPGENCRFDGECATLNCLRGTCSGCGKSEDFCRHSSFHCTFSDGECLQAVDGTARCGTRVTFDCGLCTRDFDCDQGQGLGYFCAVATSRPCFGCPQGQTFCARPLP